MKFLLDTHTLIWFFTELEKLPTNLISQIESSNNTCFVSISSLWEISIKHSIGKIDLRIPLPDFFDEVNYSSIQIQPITPTHLIHLSSLPLHHRDPFDRLIIAQAKAENYTVLSRDKMFSNYPIHTLWE